eukprot:5023080-Prymnesium_polylepis.1
MTRPCTMWSATRVCSGPGVGERKRRASSGATSSRCAKGWSGSRHGNARRRHSTKVAESPTRPRAYRTTTCTIVPAYPNELTPPTHASAARTAEHCTGRPTLTERSAPPTCRLSDRNC